MYRFPLSCEWRRQNPRDAVGAVGVELPPDTRLLGISLQRRQQQGLLWAKLSYPRLGPHQQGRDECGAVLSSVPPLAPQRKDGLTTLCNCVRGLDHCACARDAWQFQSK